MTERYLSSTIIEDLANKMVFLAGPRQVGKTTLAKSILAKGGNGRYFNWDSQADRRNILASAWPPPPALLVLDELHKYRFWKRWIKGEFDTRGDEYRFLVTGSARLDVYRKGGDSLQGRYHHLRLHPFSMGELTGRAIEARPFEPLPIEAWRSKDAATSMLQTLSERGGFPEPLLAATARVHRRWQRQRLERLVREDVRELENVRDLSSLQLLADLLPLRVGSPLSVNALREDLEVSHRAVSHWLDIFERLYFLFEVPPFVPRRGRLLRKARKVYLWDWSLVEDPGARFENLVASHLLKLCHWLVDVEGYDARLHYLRDTSEREVDFVVTVDNKPWFAVEAKRSDEQPAAHLRYFGSRLGIPLLYQVVANAKRDVVREGVRIVPAANFLPAVA